MRYVRAHKPLYVETPLWDDQQNPLVPCLTVDDAKVVETGLLFADGSPVMRISDPIGFGREHER